MQGSYDCQKNFYLHNPAKKVNFVTAKNAPGALA